MLKTRLFAIALIIGGMLLGYFSYPFLGIYERLNIPYRLGLDLAGGIQLVYEIDTSSIEGAGKKDSLEGLRDVIERRVNMFGVSEPVVQLSSKGEKSRLIVELAGVFDINEAVRVIGETPFLEFREEGELPPEAMESLNENAGDENITSDEANNELPTTQDNEPITAFLPTGLNGGFLKRSTVIFDEFNKPLISLEFNKEGAKLFEQITERNVGRPIAIYLDGSPISAPTVQEKIIGGNAQITGDFTLEEARTMVRRLNSGTLEVPINLIFQQSVGSSLGKEALERTFMAGILGLVAVIIFMVLWYRLPGILSVLALLIYASIVLALFKIISVTLSAAAITGFILSIGMAVDANILIFERTKEELRSGKSIKGSIEEGFERAWTSIRDSNVSSLITATILWWFGTSVIKGFALTLGLGVAISMFSAIIVTRTLLRALGVKDSPYLKFLMLSGLNFKNKND